LSDAASKIRISIRTTPPFQDINSITMNSRSKTLWPRSFRKSNNIVVVMMENRSFDNMCGWRYGPGAATKQIPSGSAKS
jgi:hypothetical protein